MALNELLGLLKGELKLGKLAFVDGKVKLSAVYDASGIDVELSVLLGADMFLDLLKEAIPGQYDNLLIDILKKSLLPK